MGNNPSHFDNCGDDCPVENVNWWESLAYCNILSRSEDLEECYEFSGCDNKRPGQDMKCESVKFIGLGCKGYRLPTESEWEYAARAGSTGKYYADNLHDIAWYHSNSSGKTHPVARKFPNAWGVSDMLGNVGEWTWDFFQKDYYINDSQLDPLGATTGNSRVNRGGSWLYYAMGCRFAYRNDDVPGFRYAGVGFRPARSLDP